MNFVTMQGLGLTDFEVERMVRAMKRYHFAVKQDRHPIVKFLHNAYSVAIMDTLRDMATDDEIKRRTGVDMKKMRREILAEQDRLQALGERLAEKFGYKA